MHISKTITAVSAFSQIMKKPILYLKCRSMGINNMTKTSITQGCINCQLFLQHIISPSVYLVALSGKVKFEESDSILLKKSRARLYFKMSMLLNYLFILFAVFRIKVLFRHWKEGNHVEQLSFYTFIVALANLALSAENVFETKSKEYHFVVAECLTLVKFRWLGFPSKRRLPGFLELAIYMFSFGVMANSVLYQIMIFIIDYDPVKMIAKFLHIPVNIFSDIFVLFISSVIYNFASINGEGYFLYLVLSIFTFAEGMHRASTQLLCRSQRNLQSFRTHLKLYRVIYILMQAGNIVVDQFLQCMLIMGIVVGTCSGYISIMLYNELALAIYLLASLTFPLFIISMFGITTLAAFPGENGQAFKQLWRWELIRKVDRFSLRACPPLGYSFGFVRNCCRNTGLTIANVTLNLVATLTLLK